MNIYSNLINRYNIMSSEQDFCIDLNVAKYNNTKKILEIGGGRAGWSLGITEFLNTMPEIIVVENFEFKTYDSYGQNWPKSKSDLLVEINKKCPDNNISILDFDANVLNQIINDKFDLIRIDCFEHEDELNKILKWTHSQLSDDGLLYIDDIKPTICINRLYSAINLVKEKLYKIVCIGDKSMILSKYDSNKDYFHAELRNLIKNELPNIRFAFRDPVQMIGSDGVFNIKYWCTEN